MTRRRVLESINSDGGDRCVDVFIRDDGTYGFEEFRRDAEDPNGWYPIGGFSDLVFDEEKAARNEARNAVGWLDR